MTSSTTSRRGRDSRGIRWVATLATAGVVIAAFGAGGAKADQLSTTEPPGSTAAAASGPATGEPIRIMHEGTFEGSTNPSFGNVPEVQAAVAAYFEDLNENGGVNGRPVEVIECNDQANPDVAATCARQAVDEGVVAVISPWHSANGPTIVPVLEAAGIAFINGPLSPPDYTSPISFTIGAASAGAFGATGIALVEHGCAKIGAFHYDVAASQAIVENIRNAVRPLGAEIEGVVVNPTASNFAGTVAEVQDGGFDCMIPVIAPNQLLPLMQALQAAGVEVQFGGYGASWSPEQFQQISDAGGNGGIYSSQFVNPNTVNDAMDRLRATFERHDVPVTQFTQSAWTMSELFVKVAASIEGDITAESFLAAMNAADGIEIGTIPPYSTQNPITAEGFTRIFSPYAYLNVLEDGVLTPLQEEPIDVTAAYSAG